MNSKKISVLILTFNRIRELFNSLVKIKEIDYSDLEVIIIDNASTDGTQEMVEKEFPEVHLIKLNENIGIAGWNEGFKIAKGEYILVLDDDSYPERNAIRFAVNKFESKKDIGCIAFNVININAKDPHFRTHWLPDTEIAETYWPIFVGCGAMFRRSLSIHMPEEYFLYQHELPVAADIYNQNYKIYYDSKIKCYHNFKLSSNYSMLNEYYFFRNNLKFTLGYLPLPFSIYYSSKLIIFFFFKSIYKKWFKNYVEVLMNFDFEKHQKISLKYFFFLRKGEYFNIQICKRIFN